MEKIVTKQIIRDINNQAQAAKRIRTPQKGWIKQIRELLKMSAKKLGERCGLEQSTISRLEKSERKRSITLSSLEKLADGLNCDVKYILVPREPLDQFLLRKAREAARREIAKVSHTMTLEDQGLSDKQIELQIQDLAEELLNQNSPLIWENK